MDTLTIISLIITPILLIIVILLIIYLAKRKPQEEDSTTRILDQEIGQLKSDIEKFRINQADHESQKQFKRLINKYKKFSYKKTLFFLDKFIRVFVFKYFRVIGFSHIKFFLDFKIMNI